LDFFVDVAGLGKSGWLPFLVLSDDFYQFRILRAASHSAAAAGDRFKLGR